MHTPAAVDNPAGDESRLLGGQGVQDQAPFDRESFSQPRSLS